MRYAKYLAVWFFVVSSSYASTCVVEDKAFGSYLVLCANYQGEETLYRKNGEEVKISQKFDRYVAISEEEFDLSLQEKLSTMKPLPVSAPSQVMPSAVIDSKKETNIRIFMTLLNYSNGYSKTTLPASLNTNLFERSQVGETAPFDIAIDVNANGTGLIISPNFEDHQGELVLYKKLGILDVGIYLSGKFKKEKGTASLSTTTATDETTESHYNAGPYLRIMSENERSLFLIEGFAAYTKIKLSDSSAQADSTGGTFGFNIAYYAKLNKNIMIGLGANANFFKGTLDFQENGLDIGANMEIFQYQINPLLLQLAF